MSSLRLALKQSLEETSITSKKQSKARDSIAKKRKEKRRPGDPPRKRGRPRKHPLPEPRPTLKQDNSSGEEAEATLSALEDSGSENEFSASNESDGDQSETERVNEDNKDEEKDEGNREEDSVEKKAVAKKESKEEDAPEEEQATEQLNDTDEARELALKKQRRLLKKQRKQQNSAANKIQTNWKKKRKSGQDARSQDQNAETEESPEKEEEQPNPAPAPTPAPQLASRPSSPKPPRVLGEEESEQAAFSLSKKNNGGSSSTTYTVPPPSPELVEWCSQLPRKRQRRSVKQGLRVKVRFVTEKPRKRDGKITKKLKWYGGEIIAVSPKGSKIRIQYDDGTSEETTFPDQDVIVDDEGNGTHSANAGTFIPPPREEHQQQEEGDEGEELAIVEKEQPVVEKKKEDFVPPKPPKKPKLKTPDADLLEQENKNEGRDGREDPTIDITKETPADLVEIKPVQVDGHPSDHKIVPENAKLSTEAYKVEKEPKHPKKKAYTPVENEPIDSVQPNVGKEVEDSSKKIEDETAAISVHDAPTKAEGKPADVDKPTEPEQVHQSKSGGHMHPKFEGEKPKVAPREENLLRVIEGKADRDDNPVIKPRKKSFMKPSSSAEDLGEKKKTAKAVMEERSESNEKAEVVERKSKKMKIHGIEKDVQTAPVETKKLKVFKRTTSAEAEVDHRISAMEASQPKAHKRKREDRERAASPRPSKRSHEHRTPKRTATPEPSRLRLAEDDIKAERQSLHKSSKGSEDGDEFVSTKKPRKEPSNSRNSAFDHKVRVKERKRQQHYDDGDDVSRTLTPTPEKDGLVSAPRSGRRAAQQAIQRIASRQELVIPDSQMSKPKKRKGDRDGRLISGREKRPRKTPENSQMSEDDHQWVQCDNCLKWRVLPSTVDLRKLPKKWYCEMNEYDTLHNFCEAPEQTATEQTAEEIARIKRKERKRLRRLAAAAGEDPDHPHLSSRERTRERHSRSPVPLEDRRRDRGEGKGKRVSPVSSDGSVDRSPGSDSETHKHERKGGRGRRGKPDEPELLTSGSGEVATPRGRPRGRGRRGKESKEDKGKGKSSQETDNLEWVQCEKCEKWRRLPPHISADALPDVWYCSMNSWNPGAASCSAAEDKADPNTREYTIIGQTIASHGGGHKLSYRNLIFGTGKKQHRPLSERTRAAESLFSAESPDGHPTVMYNTSSLYIPRGSSRSQEDKEPEGMSFFELMSHSNLWAELWTVGKPLSSSDRALSSSAGTGYDALSESRKKQMKDLILCSLGTGTLGSHEILLHIQCRPVEGSWQQWCELQDLCTADTVDKALVELVRERKVEETGDASDLRYKKIVQAKSASDCDVFSKASRCIKIAKPWRQGKVVGSSP